MISEVLQTRGLVQEIVAAIEWVQKNESLSGHDLKAETMLRSGLSVYGVSPGLEINNRYFLSLFYE